MPPRINAAAISSLIDAVSERKITPPAAAMTGTASWSTAARVVV